MTWYGKYDNERDEPGPTWEAVHAARAQAQDAEERATRAQEALRKAKAAAPADPIERLIAATEANGKKLDKLIEVLDSVRSSDGNGGYDLAVIVTERY